LGDASPTGPSVTIEYDGKPLADCHVTLCVRDGAEFREQWEGFSGHDGIATLKLMRGADATLPVAGAYRAIVVSHGDGGWQLDTRFADPKTSGIDVMLAADASGLIRLPAGAVKPL
jgi:hypothetical protein